MATSHLSGHDRRSPADRIGLEVGEDCVAMADQVNALDLGQRLLRPVAETTIAGWHEDDAPTAE